MRRVIRNFAYLFVGLLLGSVAVYASAATEVVMVDYSPDGRLMTVVALFFAAFLGFLTGYRA
ncbi:hypothetical protein [Dechloromonas hortensis]|uniref:hypothetical protein n=1 Tax=Dechloromonas hortensis TaxID=337779 RepID=UPI0012926047|nr:hypothetical protein [Dechloromonas hortensis]